MLEIFLNIDQYLLYLVQTYEWQVYFILFVVVLLETGCILTPFLPGNSLLFATGVLVSTGSLNYISLIIAYLLAAILGAIMNYYIGVNFGAYIKSKKWISEDQLRKSAQFFERYGANALIISRFVPYIHIFVPFFAAIIKFNLRLYIRYNIIAAILWVFFLVTLGAFLGQVPFVKNNFSLVLTTIVLATTLPVIFSFLFGKKESENE